MTVSDDIMPSGSPIGIARTTSDREAQSLDLNAIDDLWHQSSCWTWRCIGRVEAFWLEGRGFESCSSHHV